MIYFGLKQHFDNLYVVCILFKNSVKALKI